MTAVSGNPEVLASGDRFFGYQQGLNIMSHAGCLFPQDFPFRSQKGACGRRVSIPTLALCLKLKKEARLLVLL